MRCLHTQTTDLPGSGTVRSVVGSMGVPLYPEETDAGYALTKARTFPVSCLCTAADSGPCPGHHPPTCFMSGQG